MNNLKKIRGKHELSLAQLSKALGMTKEGLRHNEDKTLSVKTALKAAEYLGENVFEILGSDVLTLIPFEEEDKEIVIKMIKEL